MLPKSHLACVCFFFSILSVKNPVTTVTSVTRGIFWRPDAIYMVTVLVTVTKKSCYHDCYYPKKRLLPRAHVAKIT